VLVFDGARAAFVEGPVLDDGSLDGPHLVSADHWHHFEMDIALYVPAFFDYPAEFRGMTVVEGRNAYILHVNLPMGGEVVYWVDAESYLPIGVSLPDWELERAFGEWEKVGGYLLPRAFWAPSSPNDVTHLEHLEVNADLDDSRFRLPDGLETRE
jgi:hypothetical protein